MECLQEVEAGDEGVRHRQAHFRTLRKAWICHHGLNGMPIESVSRVLGHTNIVTTQIYAKITTQKLDNDLTILGNKLNASFNNIKIA